MNERLVSNETVVQRCWESNSKKKTIKKTVRFVIKQVDKDHIYTVKS